MAVPRDPAFWKRFSMAVHMDEEKGQGGYQLPGSDDWLVRQNKKKSRRTCLCWTFWLCFFVFIAGVIAIVVWLLQSGVLDNKNTQTGSGNDDGTT
ncbi:hypothetical protein B0A50_08298 [Salinomyces thailandicus]|uniref:Uncharacterized protein n=1 Tax=Salinomyces thailandicus TaxID=706561 RepID=A0A4V5N4U3_9PEZI|nr:hypothetical protein B0A50_08298 [Salinomyces thailandica]